MLLLPLLPPLPCEGVETDCLEDNDYLTDGVDWIVPNSTTQED